MDFTTDNADEPYIYDPEMAYKSMLGMLTITRKEKGIEQAEMAIKLGISQPALSRVESGKQPMRLIEYIKYLEELDLEIHLHQYGVC